ncbi:DUF4112 domain-containing protein [Leptolyngbya sp. AN02str]|uniref:DUF4112 domain-containing protein n=1 Tax=Leptolyngbya sp. AN02str TaxID=3423363 RepID=UPI003D31F167
MAAPIRPKSQNHTAVLRRVRTLSLVLDNAVRIPGTRFRVGLDPVLGLIPGGGDTLSTAIASYIVLEAIRLRLPRETLVKMFTNLLTDTVLGSVPIAGDVFDVVWKANARNLALLEAHFADPSPGKPASRWFLIVMAIAVIGIVVGVAVFVTLLLQFVWSLLTSGGAVG